MFKFLKSKQEASKPINYFFYCAAFLYVTILSAFLLFSREGSLSTKFFFLLYAVAQAFLEISVFALIGSWIRRKAPLFAYRIYIGICFLFLIGYFVHFILVRLMDVSISYMFKLLFGEGISHFFAAFAALNLNSWMTILGVLLLIFLPLMGIAIYEITKRLAGKKVRILSEIKLIKTICILCLGLLTLDIASKPLFTAKTHSEYEKALPLGQTFLSPSYPTFDLETVMKPARNERDVQKALASTNFTLAKKPNIFLFVIETFRKDHITQEIAPNFASFQKDFFSFPLSLANANGTHISWYSIFHSNFPHHWSEVKKTWNKGSVPLQILKKMGYQVKVFSSAELSFFQMDETLFGKNRELVDEFKDFGSDWSSSSSERDQRALNSLEDALNEESSKEGNVFVIFLDSTHSEYSWPDDFEPKFTPFVKNIDYLGMAGSKKELELVKNRYKNSVNFVDHLFGLFVKSLKEKNLFEESVIAVTGDHGEEFFERGALFHGSHINELQTQVPIFYKFGMKKPSNQETLASQMDIFPSILHYLTGESNFSSLFDGESIFLPKKWPYVLTVQQNGAKAPNEFSLHDGSHKLLAKFPLKESDTPLIEIMALQDLKENTLTLETIEKAHFQDALKPLILEKE